MPILYSCPRRTLHPNCAAVVQYDVPADGQAQPGAAARVAAVLLHPVEALEDPLLGVERDPRPVVGDHEGAVSLLLPTETVTGLPAGCYRKAFSGYCETLALARRNSPSL